MPHQSTARASSHPAHAAGERFALLPLSLSGAAAIAAAQPRARRATLVAMRSEAWWASVMEVNARAREGTASRDDVVRAREKRDRRCGLRFFGSRSAASS